MEFSTLIQLTALSLNQNFNSLLKSLSVPFIAFIILDYFNVYHYNQINSWIIYSLQIILWTILALNTHRTVLLGASSVSQWGISKWTLRELNFILATISISLIFIPLLFIKALGILILFPLLLVLYMLMRLSLTFPDIAIYSTINFQRSWDMTRNHITLMFRVVILLPFLLGLPMLILNFLGGNLLIESIYSNFIVIFEIAALSKCYGYIASLEK